jgi:hypothetical protein
LIRAITRANHAAHDELEEGGLTVADTSDQLGIGELLHELADAPFGELGHWGRGCAWAQKGSHLP